MWCNIVKLQCRRWQGFNSVLQNHVNAKKTLNYNDIFTLQNIINFRLSNALIIHVFTLSLSHKFCRNDVWFQIIMFSLHLNFNGRRIRLFTRLLCFLKNQNKFNVFIFLFYFYELSLSMKCLILFIASITITIHSIGNSHF